MIVRPREPRWIRSGARAPWCCFCWLLVTAALTACSPSLVWHGRSPDRRHRAEVIEQGSSQRVRLDDRAGPSYRGVGIEALIWSPDSRRLAFPAERDDGWTVVVDGRELGVWDGIGEIAWSPDSRRLVYSAQRGRTWRVVNDGREGPAFDALRAGTLVYSPRGDRLAYIGERGDARMAVIDGVIGPPCDGISNLVFSADGAVVAYVVRSGERARLVHENGGGTERRAGARAGGEPASVRPALPFYDAILEVALAPRGGRVAFTAVRDLQVMAVVDGVEGTLEDAVTSLTWSPDGQRLAWIARRGQVERVVVDGVPGADHESVRPSRMAFNPDGSHFVHVATQPGGWSVVFDGVPGPIYDDITTPLFAPEGGRWAYVARRGSASVVVLDGRESVPYAWVSDLLFGPGGEGPAYFARRGAHTLVAHGDRRTALENIVPGTLVYSADGRHWACLVAVPEVRGFYVAVDGIPRRAIEMDEIVAAAMKGSTDPLALSYDVLDLGLLRRWVAADLENLVAP